MERLLEVQKNLKAPKNQRNNFGNYNYRSAEDIIEAVKPLLHEHELLMLINDDISQIDNRIYIQAHVRIYDAKECTLIAETTAFARESAIKKGMDESQITGSASSYARKYALNGMFAIDDTKDADTNEQKVTIDAVVVEEWCNAVDGCENRAALEKLWKEMGADIRAELTDYVAKKGKEFKA